MVRPRATDTGQDIETELTIRLGVLDLSALIRRLRSAVVCARVLEGPRRAPAEDEGFEARVRDTAVETEGGVKRRPHVAHLLQLFPDGRFAQGGLVVVEEDGAGVPGGGEGGVDGLGG